MDRTGRDEAIKLIGRWVRARKQFEVTMKAVQSGRKIRPWENAAVENLNAAERNLRSFWDTVNA